MTESKFNEPRIALNRIYTRTGDSGETSLVNGRRLGKDDLRIDAYGTVDELNSFVGQAAVSVHDVLPHTPALSPLAAILTRIQHELFNLGSVLATDPEHVNPRQPRVTAAEVEQLEREIDEMNAVLPPLRSFVLPGGSRLNAEFHVCRTVCRRAERLCIALSRREGVPLDAIRYLNRLSDAFFVWSRWSSHVTGVPEVLWEPNQSATGGTPPQK